MKPIKKSILVISIFVGVLTSSIFGVSSWLECYYSTSSKQEIANIEKEIEGHAQKGESRRFYYFTIDLESFGTTLSYKNRRIALAKLLMLTNVQPPQYPYNSIFNERFKLSQRDWYIRPSPTKYIFLSFVSLVITIPFALLAALSIQKVWYFLLKRITEVSNAFRGTHTK